MAKQTTGAKRIIFTGGGTAGHVTPNIALMEPLLREGWEVHYIGSKNGIEKELIANIATVTYHGISTGKLRRYWGVSSRGKPPRFFRMLWASWQTGCTT